MKKVFKSISVLVLSLSLIASGIVFTSNVKAEDDIQAWKETAVKTPTEGSLIGAGYIDVEFDNSMPDYTYEVYMDGKQVLWNGNSIVRPELGDDESTGSPRTFSSSVTPKTEVYTTEVAKHEITVKATKGSETIVSNPRTIYVSKKGLAMGDDMGTGVSLKDLNCSWYYNWGTPAYNNSIDDGVVHVPMMWGAGEDSIADMEAYDGHCNYFLGYNEPDIDHQANMTPDEGLANWPYVANTGKRLVSPALSTPSGPSGWLSEFLDKLDASSLKKCDAVALHCYGGIAQIDRLVNAVNAMWNTYHKPVWVTEVSITGKKGLPSDHSYDNEKARKEVEKYCADAVEALDAIPYVERYCWFPYNVESMNPIDGLDGCGATAMFEYETGKYTDLGYQYSQMGNPAGYNANVISESKRFSWEERMNRQTTTVPAVTTTSKASETAKQSISKPGKTTIKTKNIKKKSVKITLSARGAVSYQVKYALNKKFTKKCKTVNTSKNIITVKKLKKKKTYYFKARAKNTAGFGAWSGVKKVKIKK
ncbi:MAG: glycoside hydrolase family protein [Eubacterium sp.]|nr:glycoside hydrolase family protein [Eubacterium sp.]